MYIINATLVIASDENKIVNIEEVYSRESMQNRVNNQIAILKSEEVIDYILEDNKNELEFKNLYFKYPSSNKYIFKNFNLTIDSKKTTAIMGLIGSGKSTLIKILLKLNIKDSGSVFIDNKNIENISSNTIRQQISYVPQVPKLFNRTVYENIIYGNNSSKNKVLGLVKKLGLNNMINKLQNGIETMAGKNGNNLSGGQRQTVYLLRVLLNNNKIIILDEPTSALDNDSREYIFNIIKELMKNKTIIIITHDNEILKFVDRVIYLKNGKLIKDIKK